MGVDEKILQSARTASAAFRPQNHDVTSLSGEIHLARGRLHEALGAGADTFAVLAAAQAPGPVIWVGLRHHVRTIAPTGLQDFIDPTRIIIAACVTRDETFWAAEQALRIPGAAGVIIELENGPDLKTSRRLQIAAEEGGALAVILITRHAQTSAAQTRWLCEPYDDAQATWENSACENPISKNPTWIWRLIKNKGGRPGVWRASWSTRKGSGGNATGLVLMAVASAA